MMVAGKKALGDAGLPWEGPELKDLDRQRCGVLVGEPPIIHCRHSTALRQRRCVCKCIAAAHCSSAGVCCRCAVTAGAAPPL